MLFSLFSPLSTIFYSKWRKLLRSQRSEQRRISPMPMASHVKSTVSTHISVYTYVSTCHGRILFRGRLLFMLWHQSTSVSRKFLISTPFLRWIRYYKITMLHLSSEMILLWLRTDCVEVEWEEKINWDRMISGLRVWQWMTNHFHQTLGHLLTVRTVCD